MIQAYTYTTGLYFILFFSHSNRLNLTLTFILK